MDEGLLRLLFTLAVAFLISFSATPIVKGIAAKIGAMDVPKDNRRMHKKPIPRLGGLAIFYGFIVAVLCFSDINSSIRGVLIGAVIIVTLGVVDDVMDLPALVKLVVQVIAAGIVVLHGVTIEHFANPIFWNGTPYIKLGVFAIPITIIWIIGITNAVNLIDGLDGLAVGVSSISSVSLFCISLITQDTSISILTAAVAGAGFGFLPYNLYPASIFMGDTGATFLGFILSCVSILGVFKGYAIVSIAVPFLILGLPIFDTGFAIIRRLLKGQSPMSPDRGHLHHRLIDMGFDQKQTVLILCVISALLSLSAVVLTLSGAFRAILFIIAVLIIACLALYFAPKNKEEEVKKDD